MAFLAGLFDDMAQRHWLRLQTLTRLRWLAVVGQCIAVIAVAFALEFPFNVLFCFALIACSAILNIYLTLHFPSAHRLKPAAALGVLGFDVLQLAGLLFMTGGLANPFSILICVPVIISSASQPVRHTLLLGAIAVTAVTVLAFFSLPLPWYPGSTFEVPFILVAGIWIAIVSTTAFAAVYAYRVSHEASMLADALTATELALQREQHLSALDGLAAAAAHELGTPLATISVVTKEMERALGHDERYREDLMLLRSQSERCRDILRRITTLSSESEVHMRRMPLSSLLEEVIAPHREFGVAIDVAIKGDGGPEPVTFRNPGILYGLGNIVENAVDFAASAILVSASHDEDQVRVEISDDGPGFTVDLLARIGEPFLTRRQRDTENLRETAGGLGLGLFIAKTLLERSGASLRFGNRPNRRSGAQIRIIWQRSVFENVDLVEKETI